LIDPCVNLCGSLLHYEQYLGNLTDQKKDLLY